MDDLRLALLIAGIAIVAGIYAFARLSRRNAAQREDEPEFIAREDGASLDSEASLDPRPGEDAAGDRIDVGALGGMFALRREASDAELSVDVSILAGLRATYERTLDGALDGAPDHGLDGSPSDDAPDYAPDYALDRPMDGASDHTPDDPLDHAPDGVPEEPSPGRGTGSVPDHAPDGVPEDPPEGPVEASAPSVPPTSPPDPGAVAPLAVDMSRPLVYFTLVSKQEPLPGRGILDALDAEGFRPGLMQLYYWRRDAEPSVVFGVANMVEPGVLDPDTLPETETPGLVPFMSIPEDAASAFRTLDAMIAVGRRLALRLDATLCDETRSTLTAQAENHLREKVADILRRDRI